jgi:hypothetical protein
VVVVKELASELKIKPTAEAGKSFPDVLRLGFYIFVVIKAYFHF